MTMLQSAEPKPSEIVAYLNRYVIGQDKAKRAVAVALRNRMRRRRLPEEIAREIAPKNILMVGPTGVGKTEIARRLARLVQAPFVKVEATKFTEVGYVGRDVESMIRDLAESAVQMIKSRKLQEVQSPAADRAEERILDALLPQPKKERNFSDISKMFGSTSTKEEEPAETQERERFAATRERLREMLREGKMEDREIEIEVTESSGIGMPLFGGSGMEEMGMNINEMLGNLMPKKSKRTRMDVASARRMLQAEEAEKLVDMEAVSQEALEKAAEEGIVFIDEIDKVAAGGGAGSAPDVSREGVQRDMLPIVEGSTIQTKYGSLSTEHVLFIAAGAFTSVKPSDLVPELQGRLPIRVELASLKEGDLQRILHEPDHSLVKQYQALLGAEELELEFLPEALQEIASFAAAMNREMENIGARRLHTMLELLLEGVSFDAPDLEEKHIVVDAAFVREKLGDVTADSDMRKYLL